MMNSRRKWRNKQKKRIGRWNIWWRCFKNKPNLSCTPFSLFYFRYLYIFICLLLNLCLCFWITVWSILMCFWTIPVLLNIMLLNCVCSCVFFSTLCLLIVFFSPSLLYWIFLTLFFPFLLFVLKFILFVDDKRGSRCIVFKGSEPH